PLRAGTNGKAEPARADGSTPPSLAPRPANSVYHFLVPSSGMVAYADDAVVKDLKPAAAEALRAWRASLSVPFTAAEVANLVELSDRVDNLWAQWAQERVFRARFLRQPIALWGQPSNERDRVADASASHGTGEKPTGAPPHHFRSVEECEEFIVDRNKKTSSGARLKAVMDYWGALWFWPVLD